MVKKQDKLYELIFRLAKFLVADKRQATLEQLAETINVISGVDYFDINNGSGIAKDVREAYQYALKTYQQNEADCIRQAFTTKNGGPLKF